MSWDKLNELVFSTDGSHLKQTPAQPQRPQTDGVVRIHKQTKGRKGAGVSIITGLPLLPDEMKELAAKLKKKCGCGGAVKDDTIEIQGDKRDVLKAELEKLGYQVKLAGG